jgi:hypothetical protein
VEQDQRPAHPVDLVVKLELAHEFRRLCAGGLR